MRINRHTNSPFRPRVYEFTYDLLYAMRVERNLSFTQIARKYKCDHTTVMHACQRLGIPTKRKLIKPEGFELGAQG